MRSVASHTAKANVPQVVDDVLAPVVVADDDGLEVTGGVEGVTGGLQLLAQLHVVVDLTVEGQGVAGGLAFLALLALRIPLERLVGVLQVDDGQSVESEDDIIVVPGPVLVRAAVTHAGQGVGHGVQRTGARRRGR